MKIVDVKIQVIKRDILVPSGIGDFYESFVSEAVFNFGVREDIEIDKQGYAHLPKAPGLDMEVDWDYINQHTIATI